MINFDEEVKKFRPTLEVDQAEDAIYHNDLKDISDIMQEVTEDGKNRRRNGRCNTSRQ